MRNARDHQRHQAAGSAVRSQPSPGAVETHRGTALEGGRFYVWDEDRQTAVAWANELAAAATRNARAPAAVDRETRDRPLDGSSVTKSPERRVSVERSQ